MSTTVIICIAVMGFLPFVLGANVTRIRAQRGAAGPQMPTDPSDRLLIAQRAHGNATEYVPTLALLLVVCSTLTDGWWLDTMAIAATAARLLHAYGMLSTTTLAAHGPVRDTAATLTYVSGLALCITTLATV